MAKEQLTSRSAHVWYLFQDDVRGAATLERARGLLSEDEVEELEGFALEHVKREYLLAKALCRTTLSRYADKGPRDWSFSRNEYGRPEIRTASGPPPLRFNITHSRGIVACLVTLASDAGIDAEDMTRGVDMETIAAAYFSSEEAAGLKALSPDRRNRRFYALWTLKEAYLKARGKGLSLPLDACTFRVQDSGLIEARFDVVLGDDPGEWQFGLYYPSDRHVMATAIRRAPGSGLSVELYRAGRTFENP